MAVKEVKEKKVREADVEKPQDPYLYFFIKGKMQRLILGVMPGRPTLPDHIAKLLEDEEARIAREERRKRPSEASEENGGETLTRREEWMKTALEDEKLDPDAKRVIAEALKDLTVPEKMNRAILRATNTFPRSKETGNFVVPVAWFYGALKAALWHDLGLYRDNAREIVRGCVTILPDEIDLGTAVPDEVVNANVPLPGSRPGEAQATIKRFHAVDPSKHGKAEFSITVKVLDSAFAQPLAKNVQRIFTLIGTSGLGGSRPMYGTFDLVSCEKVERKKAASVMAD